MPNGLSGCNGRRDDRRNAAGDACLYYFCVTRAALNALKAAETERQQPPGSHTEERSARRPDGDVVRDKRGCVKVHLAHTCESSSTAIRKPLKDVTARWRPVRFSLFVSKDFSHRSSKWHNWYYCSPQKNEIKILISSK